MNPSRNLSETPPSSINTTTWMSLVFVLVSVTALAQDSFTNGLVAYYPFNGNANDASGNGGDGTVVGADQKYSYDRFGALNALYLNTTSTPAPDLDGAYVVVPRNASLDFNGDFTLSVWLKLDHFTNWHPHNLISNGHDTNSANLRCVSHVDAEGRDFLQYVFKVDALGNPDPTGNINSVANPLDQTWWQFSAVRSGNLLKLFRNGSLLTNAIVSAPAANSSEIWIGRHRVPYSPAVVGSYPLVGGIDDIRMYNRALSAQEIRQLYQYESNPLPYLTIAIKTIRLTVFVELGKTNQLESSTNLIHWTAYGPPIEATNSIFYQDVDVLEGQQFFRVRWLIP